MIELKNNYIFRLFAQINWRNNNVNRKLDEMEV